MIIHTPMNTFKGVLPAHEFLHIHYLSMNFYVHSACSCLTSLDLSHHHRLIGPYEHYPLPCVCMCYLLPLHGILSVSYPYKHYSHVTVYVCFLISIAWHSFNFPSICKCLELVFAHNPTHTMTKPNLFD